MRKNKFIIILCGFCLLIVFASACKKKDEPFNANGEYDGQPCPDAPTISWGGQTYNTVQIGTQCWMKENLNIGTMILGADDMLDNDTIEKYCYDDDPANCEIYGGLYQWDEMMNYVILEGAPGICPEGWHIPKETDWYVLFYYLGIHEAGGHMKETGFDHWLEPNQGATNESGFTTLPGGFRQYDISIKYRLLGKTASYWSSTKFSPDQAKSFGFSYLDSGFSGGWPTVKTGYSARCVKD